MRDRGQAARRAGAALVAACAACAEGAAYEDPDDATQLYFPLAVESAGDGRHAWVVSTDFDHRFGRGWLTRVDVPALAAGGEGALVRGTQVPSLASRLAPGGAAGAARQWYLSHRGIGVVTVLDAVDGAPPSLACGARAPDQAPMPTALAASDCDRDHLIELGPPLLAAGDGGAPLRATLDAAALVFLPAGGGSPAAWPHDRLLVGTLGRADAFRGVSGRVVALELSYGADGRQATVLGPALDLGLGVGAMVAVAADGDAASAQPPLPEVIASTFPVARHAGRVAPGPMARAAPPLPGLATAQQGALARLRVPTRWQDTAVDASTHVALDAPLGGLEMVGLAADPADANHLVGVSRGPDAVFELVRRPEVRGAGGALTPTTSWAQGTFVRALPGAEPQAFTCFAHPKLETSVVAVAGAGDDSLALLDARGGDVLARLSLADHEVAPEGASPAGVAHLSLAAPSPTVGGRELTEVLLVTLFYRHALALVDVSSARPADWGVVATVAGADVRPARRFR